MYLRALTSRCFDYDCHYTATVSLPQIENRDAARTDAVPRIWAVARQAGSDVGLITVDLITVEPVHVEHITVELNNVRPNGCRP